MGFRHRIGATVYSIVLTVFLVMPVTSNAQDASAIVDEESLHQELRDLRDRLDDAVLARNKDAVLADFTNELHFTAINNEHVSGLKDANAYFERMLVGSDSFIEEMRVTLEPDALSTLYFEGPVAISTGTTEAYFKTTSGVDMSAPLRWTATMVREEGRWKVAAAHFSANIFDNPVASELTRYVAAIGAIVALVFLALGYFLGRRRHT